MIQITLSSALSDGRVADNGNIINLLRGQRTEVGDALATAVEKLQEAVNGVAQQLSGKSILYADDLLFMNQTGASIGFIDNTINLGTLPLYADNAAAKAGGLVDGNIYRTSGADGLKIVHS